MSNWNKNDKFLKYKANNFMLYVKIVWRLIYKYYNIILYKKYLQNNNIDNNLFIKKYNNDYVL